MMPTAKHSYAGSLPTDAMKLPVLRDEVPEWTLRTSSRSTIDDDGFRYRFELDLEPWVIQAAPES